MKIFDLRCAHDHRFEGWFASSEAYETQLHQGLVSCPVCSDTAIERLPSAPYLNLSSMPSAPKLSADERAAREAARAPAAPTGSAPPATQGRVERPHDEGAGVSASGQPLAPQQQAALVEQMQAQWLKMVREVLSKTENVGDAFAEEARRMHYREAPERAIRGVASPDQVAELADEGIDVVSIALPEVAKGPLQ
jgi:hypothetical protein